MISGAELRVNGQPLEAGLQERLIEARVEDNLRLPDSLLIRISDPGLENVDTLPLEIGVEVELLLAAADATALTSVFKGQIASLEPEFSAAGTVLAARAYDGSHLLHQTKRTTTFQNMTAGDIARKVAQTAGVQAGTIESAGPALDFVQQNNETDWDFLWRLASRIDFEVLIVDKQLQFRPAGAPEGASEITLRWGEELRSFRPRVTGMQQVDEVVVRAWDPQRKETIEEVARNGRLSSAIGVERDAVVGAVGRPAVTVADRPVASPAEARQLAESIAAHLGNAFVEAEGVAKGNPRLVAGSKVKIEGIGTRFGGTYTLSSTRHVFRGAQGYETHFVVAGRSSRSLVDLMTPAARRDWGATVVIGIVTQNDDPENVGRVRVSYPSLGGSTEGWWARIAAPSAGKDRGLLMMPVVGEEVLVAFEHGDVHRPYVIGSLWNGEEKPGDLVQTDGSFVLASDKKVSVGAKDDIVLRSDKEFSLETDGDVKTKADGKVTIESATQTTVKAGTSLVIEGTTELTVKCGAGKVSINAAGVVQISGTQITLG